MNDEPYKGQVICPHCLNSVYKTDTTCWQCGGEIENEKTSDNCKSVDGNSSNSSSN
jgi:predicted amidophosphoribosyltransferase